jgi:hypothetical protein
MFNFFFNLAMGKLKYKKTTPYINFLNHYSIRQVEGSKFLSERDIYQIPTKKLSIWLSVGQVGMQILRFNTLHKKKSVWTTSFNLI